MARFLGVLAVFLIAHVIPALPAIRRSLQELTLVELAGLGGEPVRFAALERQPRGSRAERS